MESIVETETPRSPKNPSRPLIEQQRLGNSEKPSPVNNIDDICNEQSTLSQRNSSYRTYYRLANDHRSHRRHHRYRQCRPHVDKRRLSVITKNCTNEATKLTIKRIKRSTENNMDDQQDSNYWTINKRETSDLADSKPETMDKVIKNCTFSIDSIIGDSDTDIQKCHRQMKLLRQHTDEYNLAGLRQSSTRNVAVFNGDGTNYHINNDDVEDLLQPVNLTLADASSRDKIIDRQQETYKYSNHHISSTVPSSRCHQQQSLAVTHLPSSHTPSHKSSSASSISPIPPHPRSPSPSSSSSLISPPLPFSSAPQSQPSQHPLSTSQRWYPSTPVTSSRSYNDPSPSPVWQLPIPNPFGCHTNATNPDRMQCQLETRDLWNKFARLGTEMIITKSGRRMFPVIRVGFSQDDTVISHSTNHQDSFLLLMDVVPVDKKRYRYAYHRSSWLVAGKADEEEEESPNNEEDTQSTTSSSRQSKHRSDPTVKTRRRYIHPDSPFTREQLFGVGGQSTISFEKIKLTNNASETRHGYMVLNSMHKYQPRIHLIKQSALLGDNLTDLLNPAKSLSQLIANPGDIQTFAFSETVFIAVTAYQNQLITKLKIDCNPFAKGFRDAARLTDFERESMETLLTRQKTPFSSNLNSSGIKLGKPLSRSTKSPPFTPPANQCFDQLSKINTSTSLMSPTNSFAQCRLNRRLPPPSYSYPLFASDGSLFKQSTPHDLSSSKHSRRNCHQERLNLIDRQNNSAPPLHSFDQSNPLFWHLASSIGKGSGSGQNGFLLSPGYRSPPPPGPFNGHFPVPSPSSSSSKLAWAGLWLQACLQQLSNGQLPMGTSNGPLPPRLHPDFHRQLDSTAAALWHRRTNSRQTTNEIESTTSTSAISKSVVKQHCEALAPLARGEHR